MTVDEVVRRSILHYPTLFKNRTDVLHHLFYVIGNGWEWQNGELVDTCGAYEENPLRNIQHDEDDPFLGDLNRKRNIENRHIMDTLDERVHDLSDLSANSLDGRKHWYPDSNYAHIHHIPEDVKPDWAEAAEQIRKLYGT